MNEVTLTIMLKPTGEVALAGPIENKLLCLGLLAVAQNVIINYDPGAIQIAKPGLIS